MALYPSDMVDADLFTQLKTEKVYMRVVEQIREHITNGNLKPGDKLPPEKVLAERLGVSRPSVREGLAALEILGLVESRGGKGNFIKNSEVNSPWVEEGYRRLQAEVSPFELLEAREFVEVGIIDFAAQKATAEDIAAIEQTLCRMEKAVARLTDQQGYDELSACDLEFHLSIAKATQNAIFLQIVTQLLGWLKEDLWKQLKVRSLHIPGRPQRYLEDHKHIFEAIKIHNSQEAQRWMRQHLMGIEQDLFGEDEEKS